MHLNFTEPVAITYTNILSLSSRDRRQLNIHCRNYTGIRTNDPVEAFTCIAEFSGEEVFKYSYLFKWRVIDRANSDAAVFDAWIDEDSGTLFEADSTIDTAIRMTNYYFTDTSEDRHAEEIAAELDHAYSRLSQHHSFPLGAPARTNFNHSRSAQQGIT